MRIDVENLEKHFNHRVVIRTVSFSLTDCDSLVITGANGSGKSTLIKMLCGLLSPSNGSIKFFDGNRTLTTQHACWQMGLVSPYLQLYKDLTAWENLAFLARARESRVDRHRVLSLLERVGLQGRQHDTLKTYSSGMLQRIKYVAALYHQPAVLLLDEPTANLDEAGRQLVYRIIEEQKQERAVIIATNEVNETDLGAKRVELGA